MSRIRVALLGCVKLTTLEWLKKGDGSFIDITRGAVYSL